MSDFKHSDENDKLVKMDDKLTVTGKIVSGEKKGAYFTQLDWVQTQCQESLGFKPFPGTLNLEIEAAEVPNIEALLKKSGLELVPPAPNFCAGHVYPVNIMGVSGAIVAPAEYVRVHDKNILELIAPTCLKEALDVDDGDEIMLVAEYPNSDPPEAGN
jgi:CTP-dependent riboflavin kinase